MDTEAMECAPSLARRYWHVDDGSKVDRARHDDVTGTSPLATGRDRSGCARQKTRRAAPDGQAATRVTKVEIPSSL
jgi:hypothetical protein